MFTHVIDGLIRRIPYRQRRGRMNFMVEQKQGHEMPEAHIGIGQVVDTVPSFQLVVHFVEQADDFFTGPDCSFIGSRLLFIIGNDRL